MDWWVWVLLGFVFLFAELVSATMHVGFFAIGAFVVAILAGLGLDLPLWAELLIFASSSVVAFLFIRPMIMKRLKLNETKTVDTLIGQGAVATEDIEPAALGKAEMRGTTWTARNIGKTKLVRGERCVVAHVDGLALHVKAIEP